MTNPITYYSEEFFNFLEGIMGKVKELSQQTIDPSTTKNLAPNSLQTLSSILILIDEILDYEYIRKGLITELHYTCFLTLRLSLGADINGLIQTATIVLREEYPSENLKDKKHEKVIEKISHCEKEAIDEIEQLITKMMSDHVERLGSAYLSTSNSSRK